MPNLLAMNCLEDNDKAKQKQSGSVSFFFSGFPVSSRLNLLKDFPMMTQKLE